MPPSTPVERRLHRIECHLRRLIGEGAALFRDALRLASDGFGLESQAGLVWHNAREIESAIFQALNPVAPFDEKANEDRMRAAQVEAIIAGLELNEGDAAIAWWKKTSLHSLAHRANLAPPRAFTPGDWQTFLSSLELILDAFDARYQRMIERLDTLLAMTPARAGKETKRLLCAVPPTGQATALRHFFERADATWLNNLPGCILDDPPGREFVIDQPGYFRWSGWPASRYLAKVAPERPKQVHGRVMKVLALRPENPFIHMDFIAAAAHFPPALMRSWARAETDWLASQATIDSPLLNGVAEAVEMLVRAGLTHEAFSLGEAALGLSDEAPRRYPLRIQFRPSFDIPSSEHGTSTNAEVAQGRPVADEIFSVIATHETGTTIATHPAYVRTDSQALKEAIDKILFPDTERDQNEGRITEVTYVEVKKVKRGWRYGIEDLASWVAGVKEFADASDMLSGDPEWAAEHASF
jgi:hypothetical protein